jgi:hypothetical protein
MVGDAVISGALPAGSSALGQSEVEHLHRAIGSQLDAGGFQITMDDPLLMRGFQRRGDLPRDRQCFVVRNRSAGEAIGERWTVDQLQDERLDAL